MLGWLAAAKTTYVRPVGSPENTLEIKEIIQTEVLWCDPLGPHTNSLPSSFYPQIHLWHIFRFNVTSHPTMKFGVVLPHIACKTSKVFFLQFQWLPPTLMDFQLLSVDLSHCQLFSVTFSHFQSFSITFSHFQSLSVTSVKNASVC